MAAEPAQVPDRSARWRFAAGSARAVVFPPGGNRVAVLAAEVEAAGRLTEIGSTSGPAA